MRRFIGRGRDDTQTFGTIVCYMTVYTQSQDRWPPNDEHIVIGSVAPRDVVSVNTRFHSCCFRSLSSAVCGCGWEKMGIVLAKLVVPLMQKDRHGVMIRVVGISIRRVPLSFQDPNDWNKRGR